MEAILETDQFTTSCRQSRRNATWNAENSLEVYVFAGSFAQSLIFATTKTSKDCRELEW